MNLFIIFHIFFDSPIIMLMYFFTSGSCLAIEIGKRTIIFLVSLTSLMKLFKTKSPYISVTPITTKIHIIKELSKLV